MPLKPFYEYTKDQLYNLAKNQLGQIEQYTDLKRKYDAMLAQINSYKTLIPIIQTNLSASMNVIPLCIDYLQEMLVHIEEAGR